jgi:hypothetical protein
MRCKKCRLCNRQRIMSMCISMVCGEKPAKEPRFQRKTARLIRFAHLFISPKLQAQLLRYPPAAADFELHDAEQRAGCELAGSTSATGCAMSGEFSTCGFHTHILASCISRPLGTQHRRLASLIIYIIKSPTRSIHEHAPRTEKRKLENASSSPSVYMLKAAPLCVQFSQCYYADLHFLYILAERIARN